MRHFALIVLLTSLAVVFSGCGKLDPPVSGFRFTSNWIDIATNQYVFCTNRDSFLRYSFFVRDPSLVASITEIYIGEATADRLVLARPLHHLVFDRTAQRFTFTGQLTFGHNLVPQKLAQQSISVAPSFPPPQPGPPTPSDNGGTTVHIEVRTTAGTIHSSRYFFNTFANCP